MRITYRCNDFTFDSEAATIKDAFQFVASIQEVFQERHCGQCDSDNIRLDKREAQGFTFFNWKCNECGARLDFGQHKVGDTLFVKRADEKGEQIGKHGWYHYEASASEAQPAPHRSNNPQDGGAALHRNNLLNRCKMTAKSLVDAGKATWSDLADLRNNYGTYATVDEMPVQQLAEMARELEQIAAGKKTMPVHSAEEIPY